MPSFQILPLEGKDIPAYCAVDAAAMASWPLSQARVKSHPSGLPREEIIKGWVSSCLRDPESEVVWLKAVDGETGEIVAGAAWEFCSGEGGGEGKGTPFIGSEVEGGGSKTVDEVMGRMWGEFKGKVVGDGAYASLSVLVTHPDHQRRGAGSQLVQWGCEEADKRQLVSILQASEVGHSVYLKHGFTVVEERDLDLKPFGFDCVEIRRGMMRLPKT